MKSQIVKATLLLLVALAPSMSWGQTITADPVVAAAVGVASNMEQTKLDKINQKQNAITAAQGFINAELDKIHKLQDKTYSYLTNVYGAVQNAKDVKKAYDYTVSIGKLCVELKNAIADNPQGLITTVVGTKQVTKIKEEMVGAYSYIASISLNKKVLLNSAERLVITGQVVERLRLIYSSLYSMVYLVKSLSFKDLPRLIAPEIYYATVAKKTIAESIINNW